MKKFNNTLILLSSLICIGNAFADQIGFIASPIVDLHIDYPLQEDIPASPEQKKCTRCHQALYNERVEYTPVSEDYVKISFKNIIYGFNALGQPLNHFYAKKDSVCCLNGLSPECINAIPSDVFGEGDALVLVYPTDGFSVGTRFKHISHNDTQDAYAIERISIIDNTVIQRFVPKSNAVLEICRSAEDKRKLFVSSIKNLIARLYLEDYSVIPYVWGGSSFLYAQQKDDFVMQDGAWCRPKKGLMYTGYDCSELVMRFAKISGIEFPWKTTTVIEKSLQPLAQDQHLQKGDLIWTPGHVMIVADIDKNEVIEARGYSSGFGCVQSIELKDCFAGIQSYNDLLTYYFENKAVQYKNVKGETPGKAHNFKLLRLPIQDEQIAIS